MTTTPRHDRDARLATLAGRIESLQDALRRIPKTPALRDVCAQFAAGLRAAMPDAGIDVAHRAADAADWDHVVKSGAPGALGRLAAAESAGFLESPDGLALVHRLGDGSRVGLAVGAPPPAGGCSPFDVASLRLYLLLFENAYQEMLARRNEKGLVFSMNHRILQLNSLIDTGIEVASLDFESSPHKLALVRAASLANASRGVVRRLSGGKEREAHTFPEGGAVPSAASGAGHRIASSFTFGDDTYEFELFDKESRTGLVPFDDTDQLLLDALARQVHAAIENRDLHRQALENQKLEQEMSVAAAIQQKIIPVSLPKIPGYDVAGKNIPSKSIGGDYYDCIPLANGSYALVIADVTGKGIPAALLVSSLHAYLSAYLEGTQALPHLVARLNTMLYRASTPDKFVTAFIAILDPATGELECVNAGHNPTYILGTDGKVRELRFGGLPLASFDLGIPYESERATLAKGERLLLYTDGVTEAENEEHELYELNVSLAEFMAKHASDTAEAFIARLIADVRRFTGTAPQSDDITALYLHRLP
jgi:serine phosphatase RsbU (regulator of sigma subunit)